IESLRAIPWIFAWTQMRLMLPAWLGSDNALQQAVDNAGLDELRAMYQQWPFFRTYIDMLEMVVSKSDTAIVQYYEARLVQAELQPLGSVLRQRLDNIRQLVLQVRSEERRAGK